jgi:hypothetical protein
MIVHAITPAKPPARIRPRIGVFPSRVEKNGIEIEKNMSKMKFNIQINQKKKKKNQSIAINRTEEMKQ